MQFIFSHDEAFFLQVQIRHSVASTSYHTPIQCNGGQRADKCFSIDLNQSPSHRMDDTPAEARPFDKHSDNYGMNNAYVMGK